MPRDYAPRARRSPPPRSPARALAAKLLGVAARGRPALPAFLAGAASGVLGTVLVLYVPALWAEDEADAAAAAPAGETAALPALVYEFIDRLPNDEVVTGVVPYQPPAPSGETASPSRTYLLQAASFRNRDDADAMRADLILEGMAVAISTVPRPAGGAWHRVLVGPFPGQREMRRALSRLREKDIPAMPILYAPASSTAQSRRDQASPR